MLNASLANCFLSSIEVSPPSVSNIFKRSSYWFLEDTINTSLKFFAAALINEIGQRVSSELDIQLLLSEVVNSVRDAFDYSGVLLLTLDEAN